LNNRRIKLEEQFLVQKIFSNQLLFCCLFGALGGLVHSLDQKNRTNIGIVISKVVISASVGVFIFFITYDVKLISPAQRLAATLVCGFYGSLIFRLAMRLYTKRYDLQVTDEELGKTNSIQNKEVEK
jgi:hypothetical protein